jgi:hypothetical protein
MYYNIKFLYVQYILTRKLGEKCIISFFWLFLVEKPLVISKDCLKYWDKFYLAEKIFVIREKTK